MINPLFGSIMQVALPLYYFSSHYTISQFKFPLYFTLFISLSTAIIYSLYRTLTAPWHGLGTNVEEALNSEEALEHSGLDWNVIQRPIMTSTYDHIPGWKANIRDSDEKVLGVATDRYKVVQNHEAFRFTDTLLGEGVKYETAGSLQSGRMVWLLAKLPDRYFIEGERVDPYLVFSNSHDDK